MRNSELVHPKYQHKIIKHAHKRTLKLLENVPNCSKTSHQHITVLAIKTLNLNVLQSVIAIDVIYMTEGQKFVSTLVASENIK